MARLLITSGPTREFIDPVRFLTNGASGRMGAATASEAIRRGHTVTLVSGPVTVAYPTEARVVSVVTTEEMLRACQREFPGCDCLVGIAAPCDYQPRARSAEKLAKTGQPLLLELIETPDILATLATSRVRQKIVGFALETHDHQVHAMGKLRRKGCDLIVVNDAAAIDAEAARIMILNADEQIVRQAEGSKEDLAKVLLDAVEAILSLDNAKGSDR